MLGERQQINLKESNTQTVPKNKMYGSVWLHQSWFSSKIERERERERELEILFNLCSKKKEKTKQIVNLPVATIVKLH
jgi:hypothetical protein